MVTLLRNLSSRFYDVFTIALLSLSKFQIFAVIFYILPIDFLVMPSLNRFFSNILFKIFAIIFYYSLFLVPENFFLHFFRTLLYFSYSLIYIFIFYDILILFNHIFPKQCYNDKNSICLVRYNSWFSNTSRPCMLLLQYFDVLNTIVEFCYNHNVRLYAQLLENGGCWKSVSQDSFYFVTARSIPEKNNSFESKFTKEISLFISTCGMRVKCNLVENP